MPLNFLHQALKIASVNSMLVVESPGRNSGFGLTEDTDDEFVGKSLLHRDVLM